MYGYRPYINLSDSALADRTAERLREANDLQRSKPRSAEFWGAWCDYLELKDETEKRVVILPDTF